MPVSSTQYDLNADVCDQSQKIGVLAEEFRFSEETIRAAIRTHDDIAERVDDAPGTNISELRTRLACFAFGEYRQYVQEVDG